jgi:signal transduction histidine kinase
MELRNSLAVKVTLWFLLLAFLSGAFMVVFVRRAVVEALRVQVIEHGADDSHRLTLALEEAEPQDALQETLSDQDLNQQLMFVVSQDGHYVAHPDASKIGQLLSEDYPAQVVEAIFANAQGALDSETSADVITYEAVSSGSLVAVSIIPESEATKAIGYFEGQSYIQIFTALFIMAFVGGVATWITIRPIRQLTQAVQEIGEGKLETRVEVEELDAEMEILGVSFNRMAEQLQHLFDDLEDRVAERVRDLTLASQVSRQITTELDSTSLVAHVAELTASTFALYHVSIFLYDESDQTIKFRQGIGKIGEQLVSQGKQFRLNDHGLVPLVARTREAITSNDVLQDKNYLPNPLLPDTRSELVVPMLFRGDLVGVLDLQAKEANRFTADDIKIMMTLAEQVAIAIMNARLFEEVQSALKNAERANQVKSAFLASMSHELRTPLNAILNFSQFIASGMLGPVNAEQVDLLQKLTASGKHLLSLINDVLDISKIESGSLQLFIEDGVNLSEELNTVIASGKILLKDKPVELRTDIDSNLPHISGDKRRIRQIMLNLVSNACKFTESGHVTLSLRQQDHEILFSVKDTGPGIAPEDHDIIFETFRQSDAGIRQGEGTGLGLPISKRLAEAHGGRLWMESIVGQGATFYVALPLHVSQVPQATIEHKGSNNGN